MNRCKTLLRSMLLRTMLACGNAKGERKPHHGDYGTLLQNSTLRPVKYTRSAMPKRFAQSPKDD